jgi:hypothetical protein
MGAVTEFAGIEAAFYVVSVAALALLGALAFVSRRMTPPPLLSRRR